MATYPNGTYAPAPVSNGDAIDASRDNAQDAEITAIEDALRTGLAHGLTISTGGLTVSTGSVNIGGPSSVQSLQVNGTSTFVGDVTFSGAINVTTFGSAITLSSGATVSTGIIRQNSLPAFSVYASTYVTLGNGSSVQGVSFDAQDFVRGSVAHSTSANSSRITLDSTGLYTLGLHSRVESASNPRVHLRVRLNDTTTILQGFASMLADGDSIRVVALAQPVRISSTGYLTLQVTSSNGANSTVGSTDPSLAIRLFGHFLG